MLSLNIDNIKSIIAQMREEMHDSKDFLTELDSALGDGDLGITMVKGFDHISSIASSYQGEDIGDLLIQCGMALNEVASSTMGTILSTVFIKTGSKVRECSEIFIKELVLMGNTALESIKKIGGAELGDKTILDSLAPAVSVLAKSSNEENLQNIFELAYKAAEEGVLSTKNMVSKHGRAGYYKDKSLGIQDPGATVGMLLIKGIRDYLSNLSASFGM